MGLQNLSVLDLMAGDSFHRWEAAPLLVPAYVLQADFDRRRPQLASIAGYRGQKDEGFLIIGIAGISGLIGARLYHVLESPAEFFADPWPQLFSRFGFAW